MSDRPGLNLTHEDTTLRVVDFTDPRMTVIFVWFFFRLKYEDIEILYRGYRKRIIFTNK